MGGWKAPGQGKHSGSDTVVSGVSKRGGRELQRGEFSQPLGGNMQEQEHDQMALKETKTNEKIIIVGDLKRGPADFPLN